jgi:hypothetical protein
MKMKTLRSIFDDERSLVTVEGKQNKTKGERKRKNDKNERKTHEIRIIIIRRRRRRRSDML